MGAVLSCITAMFRTIGGAIMAVISGIGGILQALISKYLPLCFNNTASMGWGLFDSVIRRLTEFRDSRRRLHSPERPTTAPWGLRISETDSAKLRKGFESTQMEQKWDITPSAPDGQGVSEICMTRSWTGQEVFRLKVGDLHDESNQGAVNGDNAEIIEIEWDQNVYKTEEEAKYELVDLCREMLQCELRKFPVT